MFNLDEAIIKWRRQMAKAAVQNPEILDELESHLRDELEKQMRAGRDEQEAFEIATRLIGEAEHLKKEFVKVGAGRRAFQRNLKLLLLRFLGWKSDISIPPINSFGPDARETLYLARLEAPRLHHDFIGTEHVLLGLTISKTGAVPDLLRRMGVDSETVRREIEKWVGIGCSAPRAIADIPFTLRARKALALAAQEARVSNRPGVGADYILLGLLLEGEGVAMLVLRSLGVDAERIRKEILKQPGSNQRLE